MNHAGINSHLKMTASTDTTSHHGHVGSFLVYGGLQIFRLTAAVFTSIH